MVCVFSVCRFYTNDLRPFFPGQALEQLREEMKKEVDILRDQLKIISSFHLDICICNICIWALFRSPPSLLVSQDRGACEGSQALLWGVQVRWQLLQRQQMKQALSADHPKLNAKLCVGFKMFQSKLWKQMIFKNRTLLRRRGPGRVWFHNIL